jgi:Flp pilus assembly pilin Flp
LVGLVRCIASRALGSERGQDLVEYALLGGFIAMVLITVTMTGLTNGLESFFGELGQCVDFDSSTDCG